MPDLPTAELDALARPLPLPSPRPVPLSPSALGGAKALPGESGASEEVALLRGRMVHTLLEHLPMVPAAERDARAAALLAPFGAAESEVVLCRAEAAALLAAPELADLFAADTLAEVSLAGEWRGRPLWGLIDRLIVTPERVLAVDFKTNRVVPPTPAEVPEGLLRQLGAYAHLLAPLYPGRRIEAAILWTATARLMRLDGAALADALDRAALDPTLGGS